GPHLCPSGARGPMGSQRAHKLRRTGPTESTPSSQPLPAAPDLPDIWLPELVQHFAGMLPPNEVALTLRLVNKAMAEQFRGAQHATVRLSQPVPHSDFAWRWAGAGAMHSLTLSQRQKLTCLTARSGSIANLQVLLARDDMPFVLGFIGLEAAARAGQLDVCRWLRAQGCPVDETALTEAAAGGQQAVSENGHVGLMDWLLLRAGDLGPLHRLGPGNLLRAAAAACDLPTLQRLHHTYVGSDGGERPLPLWNDDLSLANGDDFEYGDHESILAAAAGSKTSCWQAKVEWLAAHGFAEEEDACPEAARLPDALPRLVWLRQRGYAFNEGVLWPIALTGDVELLRYVLDQGVAVEESSSGLVVNAATRGHVAVMELLHARGLPIGPEAVTAAARGRHLPALAWLVERLGTATALTAAVFTAAVGSGSMELMAWLRQRGCPWEETAFTVAAEHGSEEQLKWLAAQGCPMGELGAPYERPAAKGELGVLRCLRRLGCPWSADGSTFTNSVEHVAWGWRECHFGKHVKRSLCWLLDQGCPVRWSEAKAVAVEEEAAELLEWLQGHRSQRKQRAWVRSMRGRLLVRVRWGSSRFGRKR
ncbi:Ankyrin repeat domain-containing protein, partial [Tetrabaena socialis]